MLEATFCPLCKGGLQSHGGMAACLLQHAQSEVQAVLECDAERSQLLAEEAELVAKVKDTASGPSPATAEARNGSAAAATSGQSKEADAASVRLQEVYARLQEIDADGAPARAASILAGLSFDDDMQRRATKTFSGGE